MGDNIGVIAGTEGNLIIDNINNPQQITVNGPDRNNLHIIGINNTHDAMARSLRLKGSN